MVLTDASLKDPALRIIHVLRTPIGGLFRHVVDLAREQAGLGHSIGIICDSTTGGQGAEAILNNLKSHCALGIHRLPMHRVPHPTDISNSMKVGGIAKQFNADILHGHGAKGGLYARLASRFSNAKPVYTPHGGSLHYDWSSPMGFASLGMEKLQRLFGKDFIFVCDFEKQLFDAKIGIGGGRYQIVQNGLNPEEFQAVPLDREATDFLFVGEMRSLKGVDLLLQAMAALPSATLTLVGDGPDQSIFEDLCQRLSLQSRARFLGRLPIRDALAKGNILVVPSRNESFPYVVLEGLAAGRIVLASRIGGIPEILPTQFMFEAVTMDAITSKLQDALHNANKYRLIAAQTQTKIRDFNSSHAMAAAISGFYKILLNT